jgi:hypothetical protein
VKPVIYYFNRTFEDNWDFGIIHPFLGNRNWANINSGFRNQTPLLLHHTVVFLKFDLPVIIFKSSVKIIYDRFHFMEKIKPWEFIFAQFRFPKNGCMIPKSR